MVGTLTRRMTDYDRRESFGSRLRARRMAPLLRLIEQAHAEYGSVRILDIGGTAQYWNIVPDGFLTRHRANVTIMNVPGANAPQDHGAFHFTEGDGCDLSRWRDGEFHIAHSNSVLEHVGDWPRMVAFAEELRRVARSYFVQTPNFWFPIEPHFMTPFFHWLPRPARVWLVSHCALGHWRKARSLDDAVRIVESARLVNRSMFRTLFPDGSIHTERFLLFAKSFIAVRQPAV